MTKKKAECDKLKVGRPLIYESLSEMMPYLEEWEEKVKSGDEIPTITGLALALNFCDKSTLYDYGKKPEFSHSIKKAILIVENGYEKALKMNNATGSIFALKNMGWIDKTESDNKNENTNTIVWKEEKNYDSEQKTD